MEERFELFLIDKEGKRISSDTISSHIGLAYLIMDKNEELKKEFEKTGKQNPLEFLLGDKGYITVSEIGNYYKEVVYDSKLSTEKQIEWIEYYRERQYKTRDLAKEKEMLERGG